jgi:hypothetical protein
MVSWPSGNDRESVNRGWRKCGPHTTPMGDDDLVGAMHHARSLATSSVPVRLISFALVQDGQNFIDGPA